jgi:hypothetical protein
MLRDLIDRARRGHRPTRGLLSVVEAGIAIWIAVAIGAGILAPAHSVGRATGGESPLAQRQRPSAIAPKDVAAARDPVCVAVASRWLDSLGSGVATTNDVKRHLARRSPVAALIVLTTWTKLTQRAFWVGYPRARAIADQQVHRRCSTETP